MDRCSCSACKGSEKLGLDNRFVKIPDTVIDRYLRDVYSGKALPVNPDPELFGHLWGQYKKSAEAGWGDSFSKFDNKADFELQRKLQSSLANFTGSKIHAYTDELRRHLVDTAGVKIPLDKFLKKGKSISHRQLKVWKKTEEITITQLSNSARRWSELERRSYLYPNLTFITAGDERVRTSHAKRNKATYPIQHPFWDWNTPPLDWHCRCKLLSSDDPIREISWEDKEIPKAFRNNPGKSGKLFADAHPYFDIPVADKHQVFQQSQHLAAKQDVKQLVVDSKELFAGQSLQVGTYFTSLISKERIKSVTAHFSESQLTRDSIMLAMDQYLNEAVFVSRVLPNDALLEPLVEAYSYYKILIAEEVFYLNFKELKDGNKILHAITDKIK